MSEVVSMTGYVVNARFYVALQFGESRSDQILIQKLLENINVHINNYENGCVFDCYGGYVDMLPWEF